MIDPSYHYRENAKVKNGEKKDEVRKYCIVLLFSQKKGVRKNLASVYITFQCLNELILFPQTTIKVYYNCSNLTGREMKCLWIYNASSSDNNCVCIFQPRSVRTTYSHGSKHSVTSIGVPLIPSGQMSLSNTTMELVVLDVIFCLYYACQC